MNDKSARHRPRPARAGLTVALLAMLGVALLAACSSPNHTTSGTNSGSSAYQKALAYAQCIRAHGIPDYADPNSKGQFVVPNGGSLPNVSAAVAAAAGKACQKLIPPAMAQGPSGPQGEGPSTSSLVRFAECMRKHGEPNYPDPSANGSTQLPPGMNPQSPQFQNAEKACQSLMPMNPNGGSAP